MTIQSDLRACLLPLVTNGVWFDVLPLDQLPTSPLPYVQAGAVDPGYVAGVDRDGWSAIVIAADIATTDAAVCSSSDVDTHRFQIDVYAPLISEVLAIRAQVFTAVQAQFPSAVRLNDMSAYDNDTKLNRRIIEYVIPED